MVSGKLTIFFLFITGSVFAQMNTLDFLVPPFTAPPVAPFDYYTADNGTGSDCTVGSPCTIATAVSLASAGETIGLKKGDVYLTGDITVSADNITFGVWGTGENPIIDGSTDIGDEDWTDEGSNLWSIPMGTAPGWIFIDGEAARYGESTWIQVTAVPSSTQRTASTAVLNPLNSVQSLIGAKVRFKEFVFRMSYEYTITNYNTSTGVLTFNTSLSGAAINHGFRIHGQKQFLTQQGDWHYEDSEDKLYLYSTTNPEGSDIRATFYDYFLTVTGDNVSMEDIDIKRFYRGALLIQGDDFTLTGGDISNIRNNGIRIEEAANLTIDSTTIHDCGNMGIFALGDCDTADISGVNGYNFGLQANFPWPDNEGFIGEKSGGNFLGCVSKDVKAPSNWHIYQNRIDSSAYCSIYLFGSGHTIEYNNVSNFMRRFDDGGGLYQFSRPDIDATATGNVYRNNIVHDGSGSREGMFSTDATVNGGNGIYIDNGSSHTTVEDNFVYNIMASGIAPNFATEYTTVTGNTVSNSGNGAIVFTNWTALSSTFGILNNVGNICTDNIMLGGTTSIYNIGLVIINYENSSTYNPFPDAASIDGNTYIFPFRADGKIMNYQINTGSTGTAHRYTLAEWITKASTDLSLSGIEDESVQETTKWISNSQVRYAVNSTMSTANVDIDDGYVDINFDPVSSFSLDAYTGAIYLLNSPDFLLYDNFTGSDGTSLSGRSPDVAGSAPTINSGTHTVASGSWATSSAGSVVWNAAANIVIKKKFRLSSVGTSFTIGARYTDNTMSSNHRVLVRIYLTSDAAEIIENSSTTLATKGTIIPAGFVTGRDYEAQVVLKGTTVELWIDGTYILGATTSVTTGTYMSCQQGTDKTTDYLLAYDADFYEF